MVFQLCKLGLLQFILGYFPYCFAVLSRVLLFATPTDHGLPGLSTHGISQTRILEWLVISSSRRSSWLRDQTPVSCTSCSGRWVLYHWATWKALIRRAPLLFFPNAHLPPRLRLPCGSWILSYLPGFLMICTVWPWLPHAPSTSLHVALATSQNEPFQVQISLCHFLLGIFQ